MNTTIHGRTAAVSTARFAVKAMALTLALVTVNALASLPGFAADRTMKIQTSDLDLKTEKGATELYQRLQVASAQLCGPTSLQNLERRSVWMKCYNRTLQSAVTSFNEPALLSIHRQRQGEKPARAG